MKGFFSTLRVGILGVIMVSLNISMASAGASCPDGDSLISTIESFKDLEAYINQADADTLLILDVDYTLLQPLSPAFQYGNFKNNAEFVKKTMHQVPKSLKSEFSTDMVTASESQLIDKDAPQILKKFEQKGTRLLALSAILTGKWKHIEDIMEWRISSLARAQIQLTDFGFTSTYQFKEFSAYRGNYPEIKGGVFLTNGEQISKHDALEVLFNKIKWRPKKIIFVDDTRAVVEGMAAYAQKNKFSFKGFEYKGAKKAKCTPISKQEFEGAWNNLVKEIACA